MIRQAAIILVLTLLAAVATHYFHPRAPAWYLNEPAIHDDELSLAELQQRWHGDVLWIDARPRDLYEKGHIPGALLLNEQELDRLMFDALDRLQTNTKPVIVYCSSQSCDASRKMKDYLKERVALTNVFVLKGGWKAWTAAKGDERRGEAP